MKDKKPIKKTKNIIKKEKGLTEKQKRFCYEYIANTFNGTRAYQIAYAKTDSKKDVLLCETSSYRLLRNEKVISLIREILKKTEKKDLINVERAIKRNNTILEASALDFVELNENGKWTFKNPKDIPKELRSLVTSVNLKTGSLRIMNKEKAHEIEFKIAGMLENSIEVKLEKVDEAAKTNLADIFNLKNVDDVCTED